jgi:hypothetical protein
LKIKICLIIEGNLEIKFSTMWTDKKQSRAEVEKRKKLEKKT